MAIEVSDDRIWGGIIGTFVSGISFAIWVFKRFSGLREDMVAMNAQMKNFEARMNVVDGVLLNLVKRTEETHDATIRQGENIKQQSEDVKTVKDDVHQILNLLLTARTK